jgi:flavin reductase (DIM6/NTAB) family NADH-FMN oxidoreductase RutF/DNA-binding MarR family transcriptional regulator
MSDSAFDIKDFRRALGQFPTGVTVITTVNDEGSPVGVTASSFNTVSIDPPLVLWSVDKGSFSSTIFEKSEYFAVNVLGKDQVATSNKFAGRGEDKFKDVSYQTGEGGSPLLDEYAAQFECKTWNVYEGGDHLIIVGEVLAYRNNESTLPLVFSRGSYAVSSQHPSSMQGDRQALREEGFLANYLLYLLNVTLTRYGSQLYPQFMERFDIAPEEWRLLTLLSDNGSVSQDDLAQMVMQPREVFQITIDRMKDKGFIQEDDDNFFSLTAAGSELSEKLFIIAREHERSVLSMLPEDKSAELKEGLKAISRGL